VIRFGRSMPGCSATDAFEIGRVPRCCPGFALIPNQVGSLSPSHASLSRIHSQQEEREAPAFTPYSGHTSAPLVLAVDFDNNKMVRRPGNAPDRQSAPVLQTGSRL
jgi:hypothetical protein